VALSPCLQAPGRRHEADAGNPGDNGECDMGFDLGDALGFAGAIVAGPAGYVAGELIGNELESQNNCGGGGGGCCPGGYGGGYGGGFDNGNGGAIQEFTKATIEHGMAEYDRGQAAYHTSQAYNDFAHFDFAGGFQELGQAAAYNNAANSLDGQSRRDFAEGAFDLAIGYI